MGIVVEGYVSSLGENGSFFSKCLLLQGNYKWSLIRKWKDSGGKGWSQKENGRNLVGNGKRLGGNGRRLGGNGLRVGENGKSFGGNERMLAENGRRLEGN